MDLAVPADDRVKMKETEKRDKYLDLSKELKKLWSMKVPVIPIIVEARRKVTKGFIQELEDLEICRPVEAIQTTALFRSVRILRRVLVTWGDLLLLKLQWKPII